MVVDSYLLCLPAKQHPLHIELPINPTSQPPTPTTSGSSISVDESLPWSLTQQSSGTPSASLESTSPLRAYKTINEIMSSQPSTTFGYYQAPTTIGFICTSF